MIGVKNNSKEKLVARYDGDDYTFAPGVTTALSEAAARHIFGYGEPDKSRALLRLGWIPNGASMQAGLDRLAEFQFLAAEEPQFKEDASPLPRTVGQPAAPESPLSAEELKVASNLDLKKPEGEKKQFAK